MCTSHPAPRRRRCATPALLATALLLAASALPRVVAAQTDTVATDTTTPCRRCLNGHRFLVSSLVPDPFVTTHFRTGTGGGSARNLTVPVRDIEGNILDSLDATIGFVTLDFEYQYAVARWLGLRATASTIARIGTNGESVLASGVSALYGATLGATARVWGNDAAQIALTADARRNQVWVVDPFRFAQAVAEGADIESARAILLRTATTNRYTGGVRGAWAATPWLGFNALFEAGSGTDPAPENENVTVSEWALLAGFDMKPLWSVPLGLFTGYRGQSSSGRTSDLGGSTSTYAIGLLYTGRPHYLIGVDASLGRADVNEVDISKIDLVQVRLVTRFDF